MAIIKKVKNGIKIAFYSAILALGSIMFVAGASLGISAIVNDHKSKEEFASSENFQQLKAEEVARIEDAQRQMSELEEKLENGQISKENFAVSYEALEQTLPKSEEELDKKLYKSTTDEGFVKDRANTRVLTYASVAFLAGAVVVGVSKGIVAVAGDESVGEYCKDEIADLVRQM